MKYLLDTNVLSEIRKPGGNEKVKAFINSLNEDDLYISVLSIGEICHGVEKLPAGSKKTELHMWLTQQLAERFRDRIIAPDVDIMAEWGRLQAQTQNLPVLDSLIAATALAHRFTVVTRNVRDFERVEGILLLNPWEQV